MKKLVSILLILSTVLCFTACQSKPSEEKIKKALEGEFVYNELIWYWSPNSYSPESLLKDIQNTRAFKYEDNKLNYSNVQFEIKNIEIKQLTDEEKQQLTDATTYYSKNEKETSPQNKIKKMNIYSITFLGDTSKIFEKYTCYYIDGEVWAESGSHNMFRLAKTK